MCIVFREPEIIGVSVTPQRKAKLRFSLGTNATLMTFAYRWDSDPPLYAFLVAALPPTE